MSVDRSDAIVHSLATPS